jgi:hypothetical protein
MVFSEGFLIVLFSLFVFGNFLLKLNSWEFAYFSDEWEFFVFATQIVDGIVSPSFFNLAGVYFNNPVLGSYYHAFFLKLFGVAPFFWKLSGGITLVPLIISFFYLIKRLFSAEIAWISTLLLGTSHLMINYTKIGYPNHVALCLFVLALLLTSRIIDEMKRKDFFWLGITLGLSIFFFIGPIFSFIVFPWLWYGTRTQGSSRLGDQRLSGSRISVSVFLFFFLLSVQSTPSAYWPNQIAFLTGGEKCTVLHLLKDLAQPLYVVFLDYYPLYTHFSGGFFLESVTRILALGGMYTAFKHREDINYRLWGGLYILTGVVLALTSPRLAVHITRGILMMPLVICFAAIALAKIRQHSQILAGALLTGIIIFNLYFAHVGYVQASGHHVYNLILRELEEYSLSEAKPLVYLYPTDQPPREQLLNSLVTAHGYSSHLIIQSSAQVDLCALPIAAKVIFLSEDQTAKDKIQNSKCGNKLIFGELLNYYHY